MDKKTVGLIGAIAGLATMGSAHAAVPPAANSAQALQAVSYAGLLTPVENAVAVLRADDARAEHGLQTVQYDQYRDHQYREGSPNYHHHHNNQYRNYSSNYGNRENGPSRQDHQHHHHHHHNYGRNGLLGSILNGGH